MLKRYRLSRAWFLLLAVSILLMMQLISFMVTSLESLTYCTIFISLFYGCLFSVVPTIASERFGEVNFGRNWYALFDSSRNEESG